MKRHLHTSTGPIDKDLEQGIDEILVAAIAILPANKVSLSVLEPPRSELVLVAQRGFDSEFLGHFGRVSVPEGSRCRTAIENNQHLSVPDVRTSDLLDEVSRGVMLRAGVLAFESSPLISRTGRRLGMLFCHWSEPHRLEEPQSRLMHLLACQTADLIERQRSEAALREATRSLEERLRCRTAELREQSTRLRRLAIELSSAEQRERKRLATILHDDLQQLLIAARMDLEASRGRLGDEAVVETLGKALRRIDEAVESTRDLTRHLRPPVLYEAGLLPALKWLASDLVERHGLHVVLQAGDCEPPLSEDAKALLFECIRELLFNVTKYAGVQEARVEIRETPDRLSLSVEDAGRGFDVEATERQRAGGGYGLFSIRERLMALGGCVRFESAEGKGTRIEMEVPFRESFRPGYRGGKPRPTRRPARG